MSRKERLEQAFDWASRHHLGATGAAYAAMAATAYVSAFALRFDLGIPRDFLVVLLRTLPLLLACKLVGYWYSGLFSGSWRHVSLARRSCRISFDDLSEATGARPRSSRAGARQIHQ